MTIITNQYSWIPVNISDGMFSTEYSVELKLITGNTVSFFVDKSLIKQEGERFLLNVFVVNRDSDANTETVLLPVETFETSSRWATIPSEMEAA